MFDYVGLFSAAILPREGSESPIYQNMDEKLKVQFGKHPKLYWIAIGKTDFLYKNNVDYRKKLDDNGYKYEYYESDGGHIWKTGASTSQNSPQCYSNNKIPSCRDAACAASL